MIWVLLFILVCYGMLIIIFMIGLDQVSLFHKTTQNPAFSYSIIIPFRNEEKQLPALLTSIEKLNYPSIFFEIIFIDDASSDGSVVIVDKFIKANPTLQIRCIPAVRRSDSPKKDALQTAIDLATYDWIVTTDADCTLQNKWLQILDGYIQSNARCDMVIMPVAIETTSSFKFLNAFEQLDVLSLMSVTVASYGLGLPFLCNGANLAYKKEAFYNLNGFSKHNHIASGDDHFILEQIRDQGKQYVGCLKSRDAIVTTRRQTTWNDLLSQRIRWAAKATGYSFWFSKVVGLLVFTANALWVLLFLIYFGNYGMRFFGAEYAFAKAETLQIILFLLFFKVVVDAILITQTARFYNRERYLIWYPLVAICYPFISTYIAVRALAGGFTWKGRDYTR